MTRCNRPASYYSVSNGYRICRDHLVAEHASDLFYYEADCGPCDHPLDGMGAASYSKRERVATLRHQAAVKRSHEGR
jgi:hypothetical protein